MVVFRLGVKFRRAFALTACVAVAACAGSGNGSMPHADGAGVLGSSAVRPLVTQGSPSPWVEFVVPTANADPFGITAYLNTIWFTEFASGKIASLSVATGQIVEYGVPTSGSAPTDITTGGAGTLYFTEAHAGKIGKFVIATGKFSEYPTSSAASYPGGIVKGADGNLWFTEKNGNRIGRMSTVGKLTEFPLPMTNSSPDGITLGPDGNVWFAESFVPRIGRITPAGAITEFPISSPAQMVRSIGSYIWATQEPTTSLARLSTSGAVSEFTVAGTAGGIAKGTDGQVWLAEPVLNAIQTVRIAGTAVAPAFIPTANSGVEEIVAGPDQNLWFAEGSVNKIGVYVRRQQSVTPKSIDFTMIGQTQPFTITESGYAGAFTVTSSNAAVVSVSPASASKTFTASAVGAGSATITISDSLSNRTTLAITVTSTVFELQ